MRILLRRVREEFGRGVSDQRQTVSQE